MTTPNDRPSAEEALRAHLRQLREEITEDTLETFRRTGGRPPTVMTTADDARGQLLDVIRDQIVAAANTHGDVFGYPVRESDDVPRSAPTVLGPPDYPDVVAGTSPRPPIYRPDPFPHGDDDEPLDLAGSAVHLEGIEASTDGSPWARIDPDRIISHITGRRRRIATDEDPDTVRVVLRVVPADHPAAPDHLRGQAVYVVDGAPGPRRFGRISADEVLADLPGPPLADLHDHPTAYENEDYDRDDWLWFDRAIWLAIALIVAAPWLAAGALWWWLA